MKIELPGVMLSYRLVVICVALTGILLSASLAVFVWFKQLDEWQQRFDLGAMRHQHAVESKLSDIANALDDVGRFVAASEEVTEAEFRFFVTPLLKLFYGLSWIEQVPADSPAVTTGVRWHDMSPGCHTSDRDWRYPIRHYVTNYSGDGLTGLDMRCDEKRLTAMLHARDSGQLTATDEVILLARPLPGLALFRPVFRGLPDKGEGSRPDGRRAHLRGYVSAGVNFSGMFGPELAALGDTGLYQVALSSQAATGEHVWLSWGGGKGLALPWERKVQLHFASKQMTLRISPTRQFWLQRHDATPLLILLAGLAYTALIVAWMNSQNKRRRQAEMLAIARSDDLIDREARLAALFMHAPIGIVRCDDKGTMMEVNPATLRLVQATSQDLRGRDYLSLFTPWSAAVFRKRWREPEWLELELQGEDGEPIPVLARVLTMRQPDGTPYAWAMLEDLRAIRHNERLKREFIATISHELRTPLSAIIGAVDLVRDQTGLLDAEEQSLLLDMAAQNARQLHQLIDDLLDMERLEQGKLSLHTELLPLLPLIRKAQARFEVLLADKRLGWREHFCSEEVTAHVDPDRFIQIMGNLFSNAVKFSPPDAAIILRVDVVSGTVRIAVTDEGSGIPQDFLPSLFQPFAQADGSDRRSLKGSGLGLAICHGLIARMGGSLRAESPPGQGASFIIELPLASGRTAEESAHVAA